MLTRRQFVQGTALAAAAGIAARPRLGSASPAIVTRLQPVKYEEVEITGPLRSQLDASIATLIALEDDALLHPFRKMESLPAPGTSLGGWYAADGFAPGAEFGQWISALAHYQAATGDPQAKAKMDRLVELYSEALQPDGKFFADNHFPAYTYDKILRGLMDAHTIGGNAQALDSMRRLTVVAAPWLPSKAISRDEMCALPKERVHYCIDESHTLPENQFLAWQLTGDPQYLAMAKRLLNDRQTFFPLAEGRNVLINQHAYSHMNELSSGVQAYLTLRDPRYLQAVENGFRLVQQQSYATGGWGPEEAFVDPASDRLFTDMTTTHRGFETPCGSYAHLRLMRYLLSITGDPAYADSMERVLFNTVAGALPLQPDGRAFYYSDYAWQSSKTYFPDRWPCCSGTLPLVASDYGISSYFRDPQGVVVGLYMPSTLRFTSTQGTRVELTQSGSYPYGGDVALRMTLSRPAKFTLRLRIPAFAQGARVAVNGKDQGVAYAGSFKVIRREWKTGDRIELSLPLPLRTEPLSPHHPHVEALLRGPICLFAVTDQAEARVFDRQTLLQAKAEGSDGKRFTLTSPSGTLEMRPFTALAKDEPYSLYLNTV